MSISVSNAKNMQFSLRYPPDKILNIYEGSFTAQASSNPPFDAYRTEHTINHGLGTYVFMQMTYSLDGGTTWQDQFITVPDLSTPSAPVFQTCEIGCYSTTSDIIVVASNFTGSNKTITYKVVIFAI